ncbi:hypothetical protein D3C81_1264190 [compost metagenome]
MGIVAVNSLQLHGTAVDAEDAVYDLYLFETDAKTQDLLPRRQQQLIQSRLLGVPQLRLRHIQLDGPFAVHLRLLPSHQLSCRIP